MMPEAGVAEEFMDTVVGGGAVVVEEPPLVDTVVDVAVKKFSVSF